MATSELNASKTYVVGDGTWSHHDLWGDNQGEEKGYITKPGNETDIWYSYNKKEDIDDALATDLTALFGTID
jgi:hypothetical protein